MFEMVCLVQFSLELLDMCILLFKKFHLFSLRCSGPFIGFALLTVVV
jgi:hypothetical protein